MQQINDESRHKDQRLNIRGGGMIEGARDMKDTSGKPTESANLGS